MRWFNVISVLYLFEGATLDGARVNAVILHCVRVLIVLEIEPERR